MHDCQHFAKKKAKKRNPYYDEAELALSQVLGRSVKITKSSKKGSLEIEFFDDDDWLACYERSSGYIEDGIIMIALNEQKIYDCMVDLGTDEDLLEIELQAIITIMHEVGHGIVDWYRYKFEGEETTSELINDIVYCDEDEEEDLCEEFGESWASSYTGVYGSKIADSLTEYDNVDIA